MNLHPASSKPRSRIASITLAQLYVQQNLPEQAKEIIASLLAENPFHGPALVLRHRLRNITPPLLTAHPHGNAVRIQWSRVPIEQFAQQLQIVVVIFAKHKQKSRYITSAPCIASQGECFLACGKNPGSASICIAALHTKASPSSSSLPLAHLRPMVAVCEPIVWP